MKIAAISVIQHKAHIVLRLENVVKHYNVWRATI